MNPEWVHQQGHMSSITTDSTSAQIDPAPRLNVLIVHETLPRPDRCGCDVRLTQILRQLTRQGHAITYVGRHGRDREVYSPLLEEMGIRVYAHDSERLRHAGVNDPIRWSFQEVLTAGCFDLAILFHWFWTGISVSEHYIDAIRKWSPRTRVAILTDDQHGLREQRLAQVSGHLSDQLRAEDFRQREEEVYRSADIVLGISQADLQGIAAMAPELRTGLLTMTAESVAVTKPFEEREGVLFVGDFANRATAESAAWLIEQIWPAVRKRVPEVHLYIAGNLSESLNGHTQAGVHVLGYVENLGELYQKCRVFAAPVRSCTGVQTKILKSLSYGLPTVTTPTAAEGLGLRHQNGVLLAENPNAFADEIARVVRDPVLWNSLSRHAREHVRSEFSEEKLREQVRALVAAIRQIQPKPFDPNHVFSVLRVEREFPKAMVHPDPAVRLIERTSGYLRLGEELLSLRKPGEAREQFLHAFPYLLGSMPKCEFFARLLINLWRCDELLDRRNKNYLSVAQDCLQRGRTPARARPAPDISVIIPTFNRGEVLASCLAALENQSLGKNRYEVVVVDDGSADATETICRGLSPGFQYYYFRQNNSGAGAARNLGLKAARGRYVLFINDDTIASPTLLEEHLRAQRSFPDKKFSVLGDFAYSPSAERRALTYFFSKRPFLFPQVSMTQGFYQGSSYFITCNLSIVRAAALAAGSFDTRLGVAEDTELGARLVSRGYEVLYWPAALAKHDHLNFRADDIVRRARSYAPATQLLLQKHSSLLGDGSSPFGRFDAEWKARTQSFLRDSRQRVEEALAAVRRLDDFNFATLLRENGTGGKSTAEAITCLLEAAVPQIHWFYLLEAMVGEPAEKVCGQPDCDSSTPNLIDKEQIQCQL